nr:MAG TPA: hypothetical protein [Bacteriophage sp.]
MCFRLCATLWRRRKSYWVSRTVRRTEKPPAGRPMALS